LPTRVSEIVKSTALRLEMAARVWKADINWKLNRQPKIHCRLKVLLKWLGAVIEWLLC